MYDCNVSVTASEATRLLMVKNQRQVQRKF